MPDTTSPIEVTGFAPDEQQMIETNFVELLDEQAGALRLVARMAIAELDGPVEARKVRPDGLLVADRSSSGWVTFAEPVTSAQELPARLQALMTEARRMFPEAPATGMEVFGRTGHTMTFHSGEVLAATDLSADVRSVRIGPFPDFVSISWDQVVKLVTPLPGRPVPRGLSYSEFEALPPEEAPHGSVYTVRSIDDDGVIELWMQVHGDEPHSSSTWARDAEPGLEVSLYGPRGFFVLPEGLHRAVLVADESAIGAAAAMAHQLAPDLAVHVVGVIADDDRQLPVIVDGHGSVEWVVAPTDDHEARRALAVAATDAVADDGATLFWGAGEFSMVSALRKRVRRERGVPAEHVTLMPYWRA